MEWQSVDPHGNGKARRSHALNGRETEKSELRSRETEEHGTAEKRNRSDLISGGTEWICLEVIRRGMDANCRETERCRVAQRRRTNEREMTRIAGERNGEAVRGRETDGRRRAVRRKRKAMFGEEMEVIRFDQCRDGIEQRGKRRSGAETPGNAERRQFKII